MSDGAPSPFPFKKVALIGIGLIGSSLARFLRAENLAEEIAVSARTRQSLDKAVELGLADETSLDPRVIAAGADLVVVCAPLGVYDEIGRAIGPALAPGAIVTDVGSAKQCVIRDLGPYLPDNVHLVPAHPVAGTEHSGPESGFAELFRDRFCVLTPAPGTDEDAIATVAGMWRRAGMTVEVMDPRHHDYVLAITSHLPHLIAYTIVGTATDVGEVLRDEVIKYSAGGFRDFTRIAASDPVMWRDVFLSNREAVLEMLQRFNEDITALQRAIRWGEGDKLFELFTRTREIRRGVIDAKQDLPEDLKPGAPVSGSGPAD